MFGQNKKKEAPDGAATGAGTSNPPATPPADLVTVSKADLVATIAEAVRVEVAKHKATSNASGMSSAGDDDRSRPVTSNAKDASEGTGINFVRLIKAQATAKIFGGTIDDVLKAWGYEFVANARKAHQSHLLSVQKALGSSVFADGGAMVVPQFATEFIALLRNQTVIRKAGARSVPLAGTLSIPKATGAGTAYYLGENQPVTPSQQTMGGINLAERFLMALTVASNQLIRNASISAEQFVLDDLRNVMALREDLAFLFGTGASDTPRGLTSLLASANQYDATAVSPKVPTLAELRTEFAKAIGKLKKNNLPMIKPTWFMAPRTEEFLMGVSDGNGNAVYEGQLERGVLRGYPVIVSNQIGEAYNNTAGGGSADFSRLFLVDVDSEIIGDGASIEAQVVPGGTYEDGGNTRSGLSRDQTVITLKSSHDHAVRYDTCGVVVAVEWGAP